ncbi:thymus-specific serine protease [Aplochiton taeniatus]
MFLSAARCVVLLLFVNAVHSGRLLWKIKKRARDLQLHKAKDEVLMRAARGRHHPTDHVKMGKLHQPLDHFNFQNNKTFPQKFFVNEAFWERPHGPVFLYIGGEGPLSEFSVLAGHHVNMAEANGALLVALEHRFYGDSVNPDGLETKNLGDLNSQQALSDLAAFHHYVSNLFSLSHRNTWISFGGSYAGALSAWLRGQFPHLFYGAVASSAPVKAKLDFSAYNKIVGLSLMNQEVGGSEKCLSVVLEAFATVETALMGGNATQVGKDFLCCQTPEDPKDKIELLQSLADIVMGTVQYNEEGVLMSIHQLCDVLTNRSEAYEEEMEAYHRLVKLAEIYRWTVEESCLSVSYEQTVRELRQTALQSNSNAQRQWLYQACTQFGFFQTCEDASCPFSRMLTLQSQTHFCFLLFNVPQDTLQARITFTNNYYGGDHPHTHRVLYVNGGVDPWQELSVLSKGAAQEDKEQTVFVKNSAHCADMSPETSADRPELREARGAMETQVALWLKNATWGNVV